MSYLLAKIFFLLLLSALGGALLMYWWVRRRYQDITLAYTNSQSNVQNLESSYATLNEKIDNILTTINPLEKAIINTDPNQRLKAIEENITIIESSLTHIPEQLTANKIVIIEEMDKNHSSRLQPSDLLPITSAINNIKIPKQEKTDLEPVLTAIQNIEIPEQEKTDLEPVLTAIQNIEIPEQEKINLEPFIEAIENVRIPEPKAPNFDPILTAIQNIELPEQEKTDLEPVLTAVQNIEIPEQEKINLEPFIEAIENVRIPEPKAPNLEPILAAIKDLQITNPKNTESKEIKEKVIHGNRLHKASFGLPDDLKVIKGIGVTLEKMLHNIGVYYYWQIAEWTQKDVQDVDDQLEVFKGRIDRDNWIQQANELLKLPTSVKKEVN